MKTRDEALEWARRIPAADGDIVEVRRVLTRNAREKEMLLERVAACSHGLLVPSHSTAW